MKKGAVTQKSIWAAQYRIGDILSRRRSARKNARTPRSSCKAAIKK